VELRIARSSAKLLELRTMANVRKTWLLETLDGVGIYREGTDFSVGSASTSSVGVEFIEGEHPGDDKELLRKKISQQLGVECQWVRGPGWTEDQLYG